MAGLGFLDGDSRMAQAIGARDWSTTELGRIADWPVALKTAVSLILNSHFPQCIAWGEALSTIPNDAYLTILGEKPDALGRPFGDVWGETWFELAPMVADVFAGKATFVEDFPLTIDRHGYPEQAWFTFCYSPIRDENGKIVGLLDTVTETTRSVELHAQQQVLSSELGHRLKNLLAVVQAVASQTLRQAPDLKTAGQALSFRLAAFGRAADVLTASHWEDADLHALIESALATHGSIKDRFYMEGPPVRFRSEVALGLTLTFHELATNAVKYGALSNDIGHVEVKWSVTAGPEDESKRFRLTWREIGGPAVVPPTRRGFGSLMIERSTQGYLRGEITVEYRPDGLVFGIDAPLAGAQAESPNT
jgi:two-component sensor histidine kinase